MVKSLWIKAALLCAASVATSSSIAAPGCKGLVEASCSQQEDACYWVNSYKRTDGIEVRGHCRTKTKSSLKTSAKNADNATKKTVTAETKPNANKVTPANNQAVAEQVKKQ